MLSGNVLITGGAGFLGRAIIRQSIAENWDCRITVMSRDDHKHAELMREFPKIRCLRGDVAGDFEHLKAAMVGHDLVIHAAANKHVDLSELNVFETIRNNVHGSLQVARAAYAVGVKSVIGISTDKVCHPVNVYGMTKALMERAFMEADGWGETEFRCVRYGNVIGSTGSVVTVWKKMLQDSGKVSATSPDMTRFWIQVSKAVDLILLAQEQPRRTTLVYKQPALSLLSLRESIFPEASFEYKGLRPGEKMDEELLTEEESPYAEDKGDYYLLHPVTSAPIRDVRESYRSNRPVRWLATDEIREMLPL